MHPSEQKTAIWALATVAVLTTVDVMADLYFGTTLQHVLVEVAAIGAALFGLGFFWQRSLVEYKIQLRESKAKTESLHKSAEHWRKEAAHYLQGLGQAIDSQFTVWNLTYSEKEVAMLLLKGLSMKEIATVREVREKTIRQQCQAVYRKSELAGRAELSAYFLEDLLLPTSTETAPGLVDAPERESTNNESSGHNIP